MVKGMIKERCIIIFFIYLFTIYYTIRTHLFNYNIFEKKYLIPKNSSWLMNKDIPLALEARKTINIVYIYFMNNETNIKIPEYSWNCMMFTARRNDNVVLITSALVETPTSSGIKMYNINEMISEQLIEFRKVYMPWGMREPWERQNTERYFILAEYMRKMSLEKVYYADSDVALLNTIFDACDNSLSIRTNNPVMKWHTYDWVAWAGTSSLTLNVLTDFLQFAIDMYRPEFIKWLEFKRDTRPYVTDMTLWYLFIGASDASLAKEWDWPDVYLPKTNKHNFCDTLTQGFAHQGGYTMTDGGVVPTHKSMHFQGDGKNHALLLK